MIKAVIFDWGGVLIDDPKKDIVEYCARYFSFPADKFTKIFDRYLPDFDRGKLTERDFLYKVAHDVDTQPGEPPRETVFTEAFRRAYSERGDVFGLVREVKGRGLKTGFLSNTESPAVAVFRERGLDRLFDAFAISCLEGHAKPEKEIYMILLKRLGVKPGEAVHIDDKAPYVEAAKRLGMHGILYKSLAQVKKELYSLLPG